MSSDSLLEAGRHRSPHCIPGSLRQRRRNLLAIRPGGLLERTKARRATSDRSGGIHSHIIVDHLVVSEAGDLSASPDEDTRRNKPIVEETTRLRARASDRGRVTIVGQESLASSYHLRDRELMGATIPVPQNHPVLTLGSKPLHEGVKAPFASSIVSRI